VKHCGAEGNKENVSKEAVAVYGELFKIRVNRKKRQL
jgi:hypothetical protein